MSAQMRILTVRQPWAWAIIHGGKDVENRVRNLAGDYRGPIAIHAGLGYDDDHDRQLVGAAVGNWRRANPGVSSADNPDPMQSRPVWYGHRGRIIGVVDLYAVHHAESCHGRTVVEEVNPNLVRGYHAATCSPWAERDVWHLRLTNPRPLATPIPYKGALGLRRLDTTTIDLIQKELA